MINHLLYAATALALAAVLVFDSPNLLHAFGNEPVNAWEIGLGVGFLLLAVVAIVKELAPNGRE